MRTSCSTALKQRTAWHTNAATSSALWQSSVRGAYRKCALCGYHTQACKYIVYSMYVCVCMYILICIIFYVLFRLYSHRGGLYCRAMPGYVHSAENKSNVDFTNHTGNCMNVRTIL